MHADHAGLVRLQQSCLEVAYCIFILIFRTGSLLWPDILARRARPLAGSLSPTSTAMPRQVVFAQETAGSKSKSPDGLLCTYHYYYRKDGSLHSVTKGTREIWHYRRTGGKAPPLFGASFGAMAKADAEPPAAKTGGMP